MPLDCIATVGTKGFAIPIPVGLTGNMGLGLNINRKGKPIATKCPKSSATVPEAAQVKQPTKRKGGSPSPTHNADSRSPEKKKKLKEGTKEGQFVCLCAKYLLFLRNMFTKVALVSHCTGPLTHCPTPCRPREEAEETQEASNVI